MGAVKQFDDYTRQEKRHSYVKIKYGGRWVEVPVLKYLQIAANSLPKGVRDDGSRVDHVADLKKIYYSTGVEGVRDYIKSVEKIMKKVQKEARNKNKPLWRKVLNV